MTEALAIAALIFGMLGVLFGLRCYVELWKWARGCQRIRIAVAHKRKVQLQAPLTEWLNWGNQLSKDEGSTGRVVYRNGGVSVAILRPQSPPLARTAIARIRNMRKRKRAPQAQ